MENHTLKSFKHRKNTAFEWEQQNSFSCCNWLNGMVVKSKKSSNKKDKQGLLLFMQRKYLGK